MDKLSNLDKRRIQKIGPNYIKPEEIKYYKQWVEHSKKEMRNKKRTDEINRDCSLENALRSVCPNTYCLSYCETLDTKKQDVRFTCDGCGCSWEMHRKYADVIT